MASWLQVASYVYYSRPKSELTIQLLMLNSFKIGVTAALMSDALKLQT